MIATEEKNGASIFVSAISPRRGGLSRGRAVCLPQRCAVWKMLWRIHREAWWLRHWMPGWLALSRGNFPRSCSGYAGPNYRGNCCALGRGTRDAGPSTPGRAEESCRLVTREG